MQVASAPASYAAPAEPAPAAPPRPRLWPAVVLVALFWGATVTVRSLEAVTFVRFMAALGGAALLALGFLVWWWTNRRVRLRDRVLGFAAVALGFVVVSLAGHKSVAGVVALMMGLPVVLTAATAWLLLARRAAPRWQRLGFLAAVGLAWGYHLLVRLDGLSGDQHADVNWRWKPTAEELFLAERAKSGAAHRPVSAARLALAPGDWPGFRGPGRDGAVRGAAVAADWSSRPPREVWRRRVGPAWSSMAVVAGRLFTQQQRGDREAVVCYDAATGGEVWAHEEPARFWEAVAGAGPRATPTFADGRLFAQGATGLLNCFDAATGDRLWVRDVAGDSGAKLPIWGFASSPLVVGNVVVVFAGDKGLQAYRADSGEPAWSAPAGQTGYASPQYAELGGRPQVLAVSDAGLTAVDPATGALLWDHAVPAPGAPRSIQPHVLGPSQVVFASEGDVGLALLAVAADGGGWAVTRRWAAKGLQPSFNDFVIHDGHAYGFDGALFGCADLKTGKRCWKEGRYGHGQMLLLADQGRLLVVTETGEVVLLAADPRRHQELGRFRAVKGKTWNHPVLAHGRLHVRNAEEMACFELAK